MRVLGDITETIGNTPLVRLAKLDEGLPGRVVAKLESFNPAGCVKERIGYEMIVTAEFPSGGPDQATPGAARAA